MNAEYRIKISVRNNLILRALEEAGYKSVTDFCETNDLNESSINSLISFRSRPVRNDGSFTKSAIYLMEYLYVTSSDLWTPEQLGLRLIKSSVKRNIGQVELNATLSVNQNTAISYETPEDIIFAKEKQERINKILDSLIGKEKKVLEMRFGLNDADEHTLEETGSQIDVTRERVRQIEAKALRKLRHSSHAKHLKEFIDE
jgi:RNA polymerase sigma factor (sigma-70 family)